MDGNRVKMLSGLTLVTLQSAVGERELLLFSGYVLLVWGVWGIEREEGYSSPWVHGAMAGLIVLAGIHGMAEGRLNMAAGAVLLLLEVICLRYVLVLMQKRYLSQDFEMVYLMMMCAASLGMGLSSAFGAEMFALSESAACFAGRALAVWALCRKQERG